MTIPDVSLKDYDYVPHTGTFNAQHFIGCMIDIEHDSVRLPLSQAEKLLPSGHSETTKSVSLRRFKIDDTYSTFLEQRKDVGAKKEFSKRAIA